MVKSTSRASRTPSSKHSFALQLAARAELAERHPENLRLWTEGRRVLRGQPIVLPPLMQALYEDTSEFLVIQKSAQIGVSEYLINTALWVADTQQGGRGHALYLMPTGQMMTDFAQARLESAIAESDHLRRRAGGGRKMPPARSNLRRLGNGYIYLRGTESERQLLSVDADAVLLDELDAMTEGVIDRAVHRLDSSSLRWVRLVSTPSAPNTGINEYFMRGDQRHWFLPCRACGLKQDLNWEDNVDQEAVKLVCRHCHRELDTKAIGEWVPERTAGAEYHSYHLSRLYSPDLRLNELIAASRSANPMTVQQFYNASLGLPYLEEGAGITLEILGDCIDDPTIWPDEGGVAMGVDVGPNALHYVIRRYAGKYYLLLRAGIARTFEELEQLMHAYEVQHCTVDAQPETHAARSFMQKFSGRVSLCYYTDSTSDDRSQHGIWHVNRTAIMDATVERFRMGLNRLPLDAAQIGANVRAGRGEYFRQLMGETRMFEKGASGVVVSRYRGGASHWLHAEVYCLLASRRVYGSGVRFRAQVAPSVSRLAGLTSSPARREGRVAGLRARHNDRSW